MIVFSAGEEWTENPETYESSFYKRTLDNEIYIFTAPSFNSKRIFIMILNYVLYTVDVLNPNIIGNHLTGLFDTVHFILVLSCPAKFFSTQPHYHSPFLPLPPPFSVYILSSSVIFLTDISSGKCQWYSYSTLDWINTFCFLVNYEIKNAWNSLKKSLIFDSAIVIFSEI